MKMRQIEVLNDSAMSSRPAQVPKHFTPAQKLRTSTSSGLGGGR